MQLTANIRQAIDYIFQPRHSVNDIINELSRTAEHPDVPEEVKSWAAKTRQTIISRSPTSVKVTLRQLRSGGHWNIAETFQQEHHIASKFMEHPDFVEGVSARLIRKPAETPKWTPATLDEVDDAAVDAFFSKSPELALLKSGSEASFSHYPHAWIGLPREVEVENLVRDGNVSDRAAVVAHFVREKNGKMGVREKVQEILERRTEERQGGGLQWR